MSANLPINEPTEPLIQSANLGLRTSGRSTVYFVLTVLVSLHLFVCSSMSVMGLGASDVLELWAYPWFGTICCQPALLACWFVLGTGGITFRLATLFILMGSFAIALLWGASWNQGEAFSAHDFSNGVFFPGICIAVSVPLYLLRTWHWRLTNPVADGAAPGDGSSRHTFTITQLMYFIAVASIPLTLFGYLIRRVTLIDSTGWVGSIAGGLAIAVVIGLISSPLPIALLGTMLATTHRRRFIITLLGILALLAVAAVGISSAIGELSAATQLIQVLFGYCGAAAVSFWVMKCCGYRLTRCKPTQGQVARPTYTVTPRYRSTLLPLSVLGLLFVLLLSPAWHLVKYRRSHALEFEWRRRGVSVLSENGQVTFARFLTGSVHRNSIPNELLEDLIKAPNLRRVELAGSAITDGQLELIGKASSLETLDLSQTAIGDAGIQHLVNLDKLRILTLTGSRVTAEGIQQLKVALPDCNIGPSSGPVQPTRVTVPARTKVRDQPPE